MPIYEYRCSKCDNVFEVIQKFADEPLKTHESCGGTVERLISASGFQLKGSGWYASDYARAGQPKGDEGSKEGKESKSDSGTSESKPAETKTESKADTKPAAKKTE